MTGLLLAVLLGCGAGPKGDAAVPEVVPASGQFTGWVWSDEGFTHQEIRWANGRIDSVVPVAGEAGSQRLTPGLIDAHAHPAGLGRQLAELDLVGTTTLVQTLDRIRVAAAEGDGWLTGRGWDQNDWSDRPAGGWPTAAHLDAITDRPVMLRRVDGHAAWLNTAALRAAGIDASTADPEGGRILRGDRGEPIGVLIDNAMALVSVPGPPVEVREARLTNALNTIARAGLVGVHDMGADDATIALYASLDERGALPVRVTVYAMHGTRAEGRLLADGPWSGQRLRVVGVKVIADGALGSRGAWLTDPYADEPGHVGLSMASEDELADLAGQTLAIDGYNLLITVEAALSGAFLLLATS